MLKSHKKVSGKTDGCVYLHIRMFTESKKKVRELNYKAMLDCLNIEIPKTEYSYFGLPSAEMEDLFTWKDLLRSIVAVERGTSGTEWKWQHELAKNAIIWGIPGFCLLRGDIDDVILNGCDAAGQHVNWPFDIINLDYTGGIIYKKKAELSKRVEALKKLIENQGRANHSFFLSLTVNDRHVDSGEIADVLDEIFAEIKVKDSSVSQVRADIKNAQDRRREAFIYTCYVILGVSRLWFKTRIFKPIFYIGRGDYRMLNMSFCFKHIPGRSAPLGFESSMSEVLTMREINLNAQR